MKTTHTDQLSSNAEDELRLVIDTIPGFVRSASPDGSIEFLNQRGLALREEIDKTSMFEEIVGASSALQTVLARVAKVAPTDSTVLVTGEIPQSGTRSWLPAQFTRDHRAPATLLSA